MKQDDSCIEIIKLTNNSLLTLTNKNFSSSVVVTEREFSKIKSNIDIIREKISKKTQNSQENVPKKPRILNVRRKKEKNESESICANHTESQQFPPFEMDFANYCSPLPSTSQPSNSLSPLYQKDFQGENRFFFS